MSWKRTQGLCWVSHTQSRSSGQGPHGPLIFLLRKTGPQRPAWNCHSSRGGVSSTAREPALLQPGAVHLQSHSPLVPVNSSIIGIQLFSLNIISHWRKPGIFEKWPIKTGNRKCTDEFGTLLCQKARKLSKTVHVRGSQNWLNNWPVLLQMPRLQKTKRPRSHPRWGKLKRTTEGKNSAQSWMGSWNGICSNQRYYWDNWQSVNKVID